MSCYSPRVVSIIWNNLLKKNIVRFVPAVTNDERNKNWKKMDFLPCSKCVGCRLARAKEWSARCYFESLYYDSNYFITLTYNDENLPLNVNGIPILNRRDSCLFVKRLRSYFRDKKKHNGIRFLEAGEYGSKNFRPHYHINFFNLPLFDLIPYGKSPLGHSYYRSPLLEKLWGKGFVLIGSFSPETAGYTARYTLKKSLKSVTTSAAGGSYLHLDSDFKIEPNKDVFPREYINMSNGIGKQYFLDNWKKIYSEGTVHVVTDKNSYRVVPFRYYDKLFIKFGFGTIDELNIIKKNRKETAISRFSNTFNETDLTFTAYNGVLQKDIWRKIRSLQHKT